MSSPDPAFKRAVALCLKAAAALVLVLGSATPADAEPIQFDWEVRPFEHVNPDDASPRDVFLLWVGLQLESGWYFTGFEFDAPANILGERLDFRWARYGYTPLQEASSGGYGGGILGAFTAFPGTHAGVFDRVDLPDGSSRPASFRVGAEYIDFDGAFERGTVFTRTYDFSVTLLASADFPAIVPEPTSIVSASLALVAGGFLGLRKLRRRPRLLDFAV
jgi:hypothetical protein